MRTFLAASLVISVSACAGSKPVVAKPPARPCPDGIEDRLFATLLAEEQAYEGEEAVVRACAEGRFGATGWGALVTVGQPDDSQGEIGWSHWLLVIGEDGSIRARAAVGGSGWMSGPWHGQLTLVDFDADGVDELIFTDTEALDEEGSNPMMEVGVIVIHRVAGDTAEEKLRLRVDVSNEDPSASEEEAAEMVALTCKSTWRIVDAKGGEKALEVVTTATQKDPRPPEPEEEEGEGEGEGYEEEPLWQRYRCAPQGTHTWHLVDGNFKKLP